jgi:hypothetical protein
MEAVLPFGVAGESCCGLGLRRTGHLGSPENSRWLNKINKINPEKKKQRWTRYNRLGSPENLTAVWVCGEQDTLGRRRTVAGLGLLFVPAGLPENCRWSERERDATEGERERRDATPRRVTGRGRGAGWTDLRHERERETNGSGKEKNERDERNGGEKKPRVFLSSIQKFKFFFFFG